MQTYLLSAAGVIFLSVIVSLLVPDGKLNKTIVFVMRLVCIFVLIQPIKGIFKLPQGGGGELADIAYVEKVYSGHQSGELEKLLNGEFGVEAECTVSVVFADGGFRVDGAEVWLDEKDMENSQKIYEYLKASGYINISVYAKTC